MKMQFLSFPEDWGRRKKNKESAFLSKILLFRKRRTGCMKTIPV